MIEPSFSLPPVLPPKPQKHSGIGIASSALGVVAIMFICLFFLLIFGYGFSIALQNPSSQIDQNSPAMLGLVLLIFLSPSLSLVGVGLGIAAVVQKTEQKLFGIIGLTLNLLIVLSFCVLLMIGIGGQFGGTG